jgi:rRNA methylase, putative, group 2
MFHIVLFQPEIPPNTGNVIRLCANTGAQLHLIKPLGFELDDRRLRRAGLDYHEYATLKVHDSYEDFLREMRPQRVFACTTRGRQDYSTVAYRDGDVLLFGAESRGLPQEIIDSLPPEQRLRIPMRPGNRSLNLSNAAAVILYEAWRQNGYEGARG